MILKFTKQHLKLEAQLDFIKSNSELTPNSWELKSIKFLVFWSLSSQLNFINSLNTITIISPDIKYLKLTDGTCKKSIYFAN